MESSLDLYAVMGNPIAHSKSPVIHSFFARQTGESVSYEAILVEIGNFSAAVDEFKAAGGRGLNVTVPFKQEAWQYVDQLTDRAELAGAVNTITIGKDGRCAGENTDGPGLVRDLTRNLKLDLNDRRILVIGAGGAVRGVLQPLLETGPSELVIANRSVDRAAGLAEHFSMFGKVRALSFDDLAGERCDLIINGTSAGLKKRAPQVPTEIFACGPVCYDMSYGDEPTSFMRFALEHGAEQVHDGLGMLVEQAAESFAVWRRVRPKTKKVIKAVRRGKTAKPLAEHGLAD